MHQNVGEPAYWQGRPYRPEPKEYGITPRLARADPPERHARRWRRPSGCCDHSIKVKKPFRRLLLESVHPDCQLSERRFNTHDLRISGEKTALVQIATSAPETERAYLAGAPQCFCRGSR
jgi:hypothetical protein